MGTNYLLLPDEVSSIFDLVSNMRQWMPDILKELCKFPVNESNPFSHEDPFSPKKDNLCDQDTAEAIIREKFLPFLFKIRDEMIQVFRDDPIPEKWFSEDERLTRVVFAITLNLGLLCPALPAARLALNQLVDCDIDSFRTGALLSLLYYGYHHPKLKEINLYDAFDSGIICSIPVQMLQEILPELGDILIVDERSLNFLVYRFTHPLKRHVYFNSDYKRTEFSILLANLNVFEPMALEDCISSRAEWLRQGDLLYHEYRIRGLKAGARIIGANTDALNYFLQKIENGELDTEGDINDWLNTLRYLNLDSISPNQFTQLLTIGDALWKNGIPKYYGNAVKILIVFANNGNYKEATREWLLSRLKNENKEIIRITLSSIDYLEPDEVVKKQIFTLLETEQEFSNEYSSSRIITLSIGLVVKWKLFEAIPVLNNLTVYADSEDYDKVSMAKKASEALQILKNI